MKVVAAMFVILPLVAGFITPANAFDAKSFLAQQARESGGSSSG